MSGGNSTPSTSDDTIQNSRFSPITDQDQAGVLWIAGILAAIYAVLSVFVRTYIKRKCFGYDDWVCFGATVGAAYPSLVDGLISFRVLDGIVNMLMGVV